MNWIDLSQVQQLTDIKELSKTRPQIIFQTQYPLLYKQYGQKPFGKKGTARNKRFLFSRSYKIQIAIR